MDQKKNVILFAFLYFRETASLTGSLNETPKQLPITAGSVTCPNSFTQMWSEIIILFFLCVFFLTENGILISIRLTSFITTL